MLAWQLLLLQLSAFALAHQVLLAWQLLLLQLSVFVSAHQESLARQLLLLQLLASAPHCFAHACSLVYQVSDEETMLFYYRLQLYLPSATHQMQTGQY